TFIFRYGNIVINRYHSIAKIGLSHLVIANFCTWFEGKATRVQIQSSEEENRILYHFSYCI
ncbi:unnamed protein product, partial [Rotaria socialis]